MKKKSMDDLMSQIFAYELPITFAVTDEATGQLLGLADSADVSEAADLVVLGAEIVDGITWTTYRLEHRARPSH